MDGTINFNLSMSDTVEPLYEAILYEVSIEGSLSFHHQKPKEKIGSDSLYEVTAKIYNFA